MTTIGMFEAKTHFSQLVDDLLSGNTDKVYVSRRGKPVVQITLIQEKPPPVMLGLAKGHWNLPKDFDKAFDAMDAEIEEEFLGEKTP